jgi:hypothetical protein
MCRFQRHAGYDGVTLGLSGSDYHLEFTSPRRQPGPGLAR